MAKIDYFLNFLGHYKYLITCVIGLLLIIVFSESSIIQIIKLDNRKTDLQEEIDKYKEQNEKSMSELVTLNSDSNAVEKVAREKYFMKRDDEDIFVLSSDVSEQKTEEEQPAEEQVETEQAK